MNESQVLGNRILFIENWFRLHPGIYDGLKRDELRTLYSALGDTRKALEQSDIILANQVNDEKTLQVLSADALDSSGVLGSKELLALASRFSQFENIRAALRIRTADLLAANHHNKLALKTYELEFNGPASYARLAKERHRNLLKFVGLTPATVPAKGDSSLSQPD